MNDYDPKFHIDNLQRTQNEILARLVRAETANRELYKAVLKIAGKTRTFEDPEIKKILGDLVKTLDS